MPRSTTRRHPDCDLRFGDCLDPQSGLGSIDQVDVVACDPPFGARTHNGQRHGRRAKARYGTSWVSENGLGYEHLTPPQVERLAEQFARIARTWIVVCTSHDLFPIWERELESRGRYVFAPVPIVIPGMNVRLAGDGPCNWTIWLVIARARGIGGGTRRGAYVGFKEPRREPRPVKGMKSTELMRAILSDYSLPGDLVCDPFAGAGTTGVAALGLGRRFLGWERKEEHFELARRRLEETERPVWVVD